MRTQNEEGLAPKGEIPDTWLLKIGVEVVFWPVKLDTLAVRLALEIVKGEIDLDVFARSNLTAQQANKLAQEGTAAHGEFDVHWLEEITDERARMLWQDMKRLTLWALADLVNTMRDPQHPLKTTGLKIAHPRYDKLIEEATKLKAAMILLSETDRNFMRDILELVHHALWQCGEVAIEYKTWLSQNPRPAFGTHEFFEYTNNLIKWAGKLYDAAIVNLQTRSDQEPTNTLIHYTILFLQRRKQILPSM